MSVLPVGFGSATNGGGYQIERSLRFNRPDSAYLNRTFSAGNRKTWTWSCWIKRSTLDVGGGDVPLFSALSGAYYDSIRFNSDSTFRIYYAGGTAYGVAISGSPVFRDVSAWYHIVVAQDTTQATESLRLRVWINGVQQTLTGIPAQNYDSGFNNNVQHEIGKQYAQSEYFPGYMAEVNFIGGSAKTAIDFGETDSNTGVWKPKAYTGTYGTNGFYLKFADNSGTTSTTLGKDSSGNGNNWTPNNFSVTAGVGNDSLVDTPTSYGTDTGVGGEVRGNYATLNPLDKTAAVTLSNGNLQALLNGINYFAKSTIAISSGKWYWEVTASATAEDMIGITKADAATTGYFGSQATSYGYYKTNGNKYNSATGTAYGASYASGDIIGVALDLDAGTLTFYKNGVSQGTAFTGLSGTFFAGVSTAGTGGTQTINFGQRPFEKWNGSAYVANTAPSGFKALCTQNLPTPTIGATSTTQAKHYFDIITWTDNSTGNKVLTPDFSPDMLWSKSRSNATDHAISDRVRGNFQLFPNQTYAEDTTQRVTWGTGNVTLNDGYGVVNETGASGYTYVDWLWKANGAGVTNTAGQITSTVSANNDAGFSIVTYTGNGSANQTVGHGCKVGGVATAPVFGILKDRDTNSNNNQWQVFHTGAGDNYAYLSTTAAFTGTAEFYPTSGSSTTVTVGRGVAATTNESGDRFVMYLFADVEGYSKAFSYASNNTSDNAFVYLGFRPRWIMIKSESTGGVNYDWVIYDTARMTYNYIANTELRANLTTTEGGLARNPAIDILSNGFKVRSSSGEIGSSTLYIGMAFAETPFKYSLAR